MSVNAAGGSGGGSPTNPQSNNQTKPQNDSQTNPQNNHQGPQTGKSGTQSPPQDKTKLSPTAQRLVSKNGGPGGTPGANSGTKGKGNNGRPNQFNQLLSGIGSYLNNHGVTQTISDGASAVAKIANPEAEAAAVQELKGTAAAKGGQFIQNLNNGIGKISNVANKALNQAGTTASDLLNKGVKVGGNGLNDLKGSQLGQKVSQLASPVTDKASGILNKAGGLINKATDSASPVTDQAKGLLNTIGTKGQQLVSKISPVLEKASPALDTAAKVLGPVATGAGIWQGVQGVQSLAKHDLVNGIGNTVGGGANTVAGVAGTAAAFGAVAAAPVAIGAGGVAAVADGVTTGINGIQSHNGWQAAGGGIKTVGGGMMLAGLATAQPELIAAGLVTYGGGLAVEHGPEIAHAAQQAAGAVGNAAGQVGNWLQHPSLPHFGWP